MTKQEFYQKIKEFADSHNMTCSIDKGGLCSRGDWCIEVDYNFSTGYEIISRSEIYYVKEYPDGCNFWTEDIQSGKHHISGPGYHGFIGEQKPVPLEKICYRFLADLNHNFRVYKPIK